MKIMIIDGHPSSIQYLPNKKAMLLLQWVYITIVLGIINGISIDIFNKPSCQLLKSINYE
jgi:hypothetical protein